MQILHEAPTTINDEIARLKIWQADNGAFFLDYDSRSLGYTVGVFNTLDEAKAELERINWTNKTA